jgi:hypothetical protein
VAGIVRRCLEKGREERFQGAHDLALALEAVLAAPVGSALLREVEERSPYPGLQSFTERDASVFFGREAEVKALWERIRSRHLLAVIGPSGVGKTSFLRAGVIPARPEGWEAVHATPGANPGLGLARSLTPALTGDAETMSDLLGGVAELGQSGEAGRALSALGRWRGRHGEALLVVDQFEELFTLNPPEAQQRFAVLLGRLASEADVHVLLSIRDDFLIRCSDHEPLAPVFSELTPLTALSREGLGRALVEPAKKRSYRFEDAALVEEMVDSVEGVRGALPLLAFAVSRLWEKRDRERKLLTRQAYEEIGGVAGALAQHAEAAMDTIGPARQGIVREIFRNLVTAEGTRAVMDREELLSVFPERKDTEEVLRQLVEERLLTTYEVEGAEGEPSHHRVEVVHESLLKAWPRLVRWQAQDEEGALLRDQLKQAAHLWDEKGRTSDLLWTGTAYQEYELWRGRYPGALTALEEDFARSMAEKARRRRRLVRATVAALVVGVTTVAVVVSVLRYQAVEQARRAVASKLVALGRSELERYPAATLAYAKKSLEVSDNAEGRRLAVEALWHSPSLRFLPVDLNTAWMAFSADGRKLAVSTHTDTMFLYSDDGSPPTAIAGFTSLAWPVFAPKGDALLGPAAGGRSIRMVSVPDGREVRRFEPELPHGPSPVSWWDWWTTPRGVLLGARAGAAPDAIVHWRLEPYGEGVATWVGAVRGVPRNVDDAGERWALRRGRSVRVRPLVGDERTPEREVARLETAKGVQLTFRPDGRRLAVGEIDLGRLSLWPVDAPSSHPERVLTRPRPEPIFSPVFDASGTRIAWGSTAEKAVSLWDLGAPPDATPRVVQRPDAMEVHMAAFDPHLSWLAVAQTDGVAFWAIAQPWARILTGVGRAQKIRFTSDSRRLLTAVPRHGVYVWPLDPAVASARKRLSDPQSESLSLTPDDRKCSWAGPGSTSPRSRKARARFSCSSKGRATISFVPRRSMPRGTGAPRSPP